MLWMRQLRNYEVRSPDSHMTTLTSQPYTMQAESLLQGFQTRLSNRSTLKRSNKKLTHRNSRIEEKPAAEREDEQKLPQTQSLPPSSELISLPPSLPLSFSLSISFPCSFSLCIRVSLPIKLPLHSCIRRCDHPYSDMFPLLSVIYKSLLYTYELICDLYTLRNHYTNLSIFRIWTCEEH